MNACPVQRLVGVDVSHPGDPALIEEQRLDRCAASLRDGAQVLWRESLIQRLQTQARIEEGLEGGGPEHELTRAEAARVRDRETCARLQIDEHACVLRLAGGIPQQRAGHAQVLSKEDVVLETPKQVLAAPRERLDAPALERRRKLRGRERVRPALVADLCCNQPA